MQKYLASCGQLAEFPAAFRFFREHKTTKNENSSTYKLSWAINKNPSTNKLNWAINENPSTYKGRVPIIKMEI